MMSSHYVISVLATPKFYGCTLFGAVTDALYYELVTMFLKGLVFGVQWLLI
jgi:hypothetical protein